ncbi:MAG TPA: hypothetical protein VII47_06660 [Actinomycetota bacterium]
MSETGDESAFSNPTHATDRYNAISVTDVDEVTLQHSQLCFAARKGWYVQRKLERSIVLPVGELGEELPQVLTFDDDYLAAFPDDGPVRSDEDWPGQVLNRRLQVRQ